MKSGPPQKFKCPHDGRIAWYGVTFTPIAPEAPPNGPAEFWLCPQCTLSMLAAINSVMKSMEAS
jgi:hypothetical protein